MITARAATQDEHPTCFRLRREVFIEEQGVPEDEEWDGRDPGCQHFLAWMDGEPVGTARLREVDGQAKAERVAVLARARGRGVGREVMAALHAAARERGLTRVVLAAQLTALPFYERLGYAAWGEVFDDAGIPHRRMSRPLDRSP